MRSKTLAYPIASQLSRLQSLDRFLSSSSLILQAAGQKPQRTPHSPSAQIPDSSSRSRAITARTPQALNSACVQDIIPDSPSHTTPDRFLHIRLEPLTPKVAARTRRCRFHLLFQSARSRSRRFHLFHVTSSRQRLEPSKTEQLEVVVRSNPISRTRFLNVVDVLVAATPCYPLRQNFAKWLQGVYENVRPLQTGIRRKGHLLCLIFQLPFFQQLQHACYHCF